MGVTDEDYEVVKRVMFAFAILSMTCSLFTLITVRGMKIKKANGYMVVISIIAFLQFFYDFGYMLRVIPEFEACVFTHFLDTLCGLGVSLYTNLIGVMMMYLLIYTKSFDVIKNFFYVSFFAFVCPLVLGILTMLSLVHDHEDDDIYRYCTFDDTDFARGISNTYYWGRAISIILNLLLFLFCWIKARIITSYDACSASTTPQSSAGNDLQSMGNMMTESQHKAILIIVSRMKYYPLAQVLCRFAPAWNEFRNYRFSNFPLALLSAAFAPSLGLFYFLIFLYTQPKAWQVFKSYIITVYNFITCKKEENSNKQETVRNPLELGYSTSSLKQSLNPMGFIRFTDVRNLSEDNLDIIINANDRPSNLTDHHFNPSIFDSDLIRMSSTDIL